MLPLLLPLALSGASFLGGLFGHKKTSEATNPIDPAYKGLQDIVVPMISKRLTSATDLSGLRAGNVSAINSDYNSGEKALINRLTARGLGGSPVAGAGLASLQRGRVGAIAKMDQSLPLIQNELQDSALQQALQAITASRTRTLTENSGGGVGGGISGLASMLGFLYGQGAFGGGAPAGRVSPDVLAYLGKGYWDVPSGGAAY